MTVLHKLTLLGWLNAAAWIVATTPVVWAGDIRSADLTESPTRIEANASNHEMNLDLARRLRIQRSFEQANAILVTILNDIAPVEMQRAALIELAQVALDQGQPGRAQQIYSQYIQRYPEDASIPEILLKQGLIYRQMGAHSMALSKFYGVMTTILNMKPSDNDVVTHQRLVLQSQTEIAETYYQQGQHKEAVEFLQRLLHQNEPHLDRPGVELKLLRCLAGLNRHEDVIHHTRDMLSRNPSRPDAPEIRYRMSVALYATQRKNEALEQVKLLLQTESASNPAAWSEWKKRAGNDLANQLYQEGDYQNALAVYMALAQANHADAWHLPALYQVGLVLERLQQPQHALDLYNRILERGAKLTEPVGADVKTVLDFALWRKNYLAWLTQTNPNPSIQNPPPSP